MGRNYDAAVVSAGFGGISLGSIGGLLAYGLIGVFLGPVIIALGYELFRAIGARRTDGSEADHSMRPRVTIEFAVGGVDQV
jgi:hypothetical protein